MSEEKSFTAIYCFCGCEKVVEFCPEVPEGYKDANSLSNYFAKLKRLGFRVENKLGRDWIKKEYQNPCPNGNHYKQSNYS